MKKLLMVLVAATIALSVTACKKKETTGDKVDNAIEKATDAAKDAKDAAKKAVE
jgi:hypothetical protein